MNLKNFFSELKRRNVYKVALTYVITSWLLVQVVAFAADTFGAPDWVTKIVFVVLVIGFSIALILAWAFEMSPQGMIRTNSIESEENPYPPSKKKLFTSKLFIGLLIIIVIAQFGYNKFWANKEINVSAIKYKSELANSIAVLPLINLSKDESYEYFSDGMTQEITDELSKIKNFSIRSFAQSYQYKGSVNKSQLDIANELEVNYIASGSARIYGDSVKISIELFNPRSKERIWNGTYDEEKDNAPKIQLVIAKQVAKSLNIKLTREEEISLEKIKTIDGEAFKLFLKGREQFKRITPTGFSNSINALERAIELDPNYAQAHTFLAWTNIFSSSTWLGDGNYSSSETISLVSNLLEKSFDLDPNSSDTYLVKGNLNLFHKGLLGEAKKNVEIALELNSWPETPTDYCICTVVSIYVALGDYEKAREVANIARVIDPGNVFIFWDQANIHMIQGEFKKAQALYEESVQIIDIPFFNFYLGWSYYHDKQYSKALIYFEKAYESVDVPIYMNVAYMSNSYFKLGNKVKSEEYRLELVGRMEAGANNVNLALAMVAAVQSNNDETLSWLEKAQQKSDVALAYMVNVDPIFKQILEKPRFIEMRKKMQYYD